MSVSLFLLLLLLLSSPPYSFSSSVRAKGPCYPSYPSSSSSSSRLTLRMLLLLQLTITITTAAARSLARRRRGHARRPAPYSSEGESLQSTLLEVASSARPLRGEGLATLTTPRLVRKSYTNDSADTRRRIPFCLDPGRRPSRRTAN
jgi:hypothetical protein